MKMRWWVLLVCSFCTPALAAEAVPDHWYSLKDGQEYGYQEKLTPADAAAGKLAGKVWTVKYAGLHDGADQLFAKFGQAIVVLECKRPCKFVKTMTFVADQFVDKNYQQAVVGSLGWEMMTDAAAGKLKPYVATKNGKHYHVWFDEKDGAHFVPAKGK